MRLFAALALLTAAACSAGPFIEPLTLGGRRYEVAQLNRGFQVYRQGCRACHGDLGDGHGVSAQGLWPPPRDLRQGLYKFGRVATPGLPTDAELTRIVREGLNGTAMLAWTVSDEDLDALLGYVKSLSPRWRTEAVGDPVPIGVDPTLATPAAEVVRRGEALYHGKAMCSSCHPTYVTRARLYDITRELTGTGSTAFAPAMYTSRIKETEYCWRSRTEADGTMGCAEPVRAIPPDFTHDPMRAVRPGHVRDDLYLTLASGITGAGMPPWRGALTEEELWSMARYVESVAALRGTPSADALWSSLRDRTNLDWQPAP